MISVVSILITARLLCGPPLSAQVTPDQKALQSGNLFDMFMMAADDTELARDAALLQKDGSRKAESLFAPLVESHEINRTSPAQYANARRRERLMKTRFAAD